MIFFKSSSEQNPGELGDVKFVWYISYISAEKHWKHDSVILWVLDCKIDDDDDDDDGKY